MKDLMKEVEGKVKFSIADSTMMLLVQQAMDKAHEKIKTKHGLLLRLNAISLFYELAVLQLESCLNLVQQETDNLESNHEEVVRDLRVIKDRLHHRLLETELAILKKDRQLLEMSENQESLRNVLESKETELVHLQDLERERNNNQIGDLIKEDEFSELKSSVDQQVMNLRQKLEIEYHELGGQRETDTEDPSGVEIDVLKGTMDLAFNKMHHAIFLSELGPMEQSWRWSIERDSMAILIKGFMNGLEEKKNKVMMVVRNYESGFKDRVCSIRREVECLDSQIDQIIIQKSSPKSCVATSSSSIDYELGDDKEEEKNEAEEVDISNFPVSKLIKSHESIIRRKSEEVAPPRIETVKRQKSSSSKRSIDDIFANLDSLISLNTNLFKQFFDDDDDDDRYEHDHDVRVDETLDDGHEGRVDDNLDDVWMKVKKHTSVFSDNAIEEKEDAEMELMILEDTYLTLLKALVTDNTVHNRKEEEEEEDIASAKIECGFECRVCLEDKEDSEMKLMVLEDTYLTLLKGLVTDETTNNRKEEEEEEIEFEKMECGFECSGCLQEKEDSEMKLMILEGTYLTLIKSLLTDEIRSREKEEQEEGEMESEHIESGISCRDCLENLDWEKEFEILRQDEEFRQELDWLIVTELVREVLETVGNYEKIEANNKRMIAEEGNRACLEISLVLDDFDFKIQEKLKMVTFRLQSLETKIHSTTGCVAELPKKESVYRTAFLLRSENLIKAETEVDLLGDQVDSLVKLLQKTLWAIHQHPLLLCNNSDLLEISKMIKKELSSENS